MTQKKDRVQKELAIFKPDEVANALAHYAYETGRIKKLVEGDVIDLKAGRDFFKIEVKHK